MTTWVGEMEIAGEVQLAPTSVIRDGSVVPCGDLSVSVLSFAYDLAGVQGKFLGAANQSVTDNQTNYVYLDSGASLVINTTGYPSSTHIRLARVVASGGVIVKVIYERAFLTASGDVSGVVPNSRTLTAGAGLTGGGDLSADRTFDVGANPDGSITVNANEIQVGVLASDTQHGSRGGGSQHSAVTTGVNGFMSAADKTKLNRIFDNSATDPTSPTPQAGDLYFNTALGELMQYDGTRSKWLSIAQGSVQAGARFITPAGSFYRGIQGLAFATNIGFEVPKGTLVGLSWSKTTAAAATLEVLVGGSSIATLSSGVAGAVSNYALNADFAAGLMQFRNQAGGNSASQVMIQAWFKRRI